MENQHRAIKGYRELDATEIDAMNRLKQKAEEIGALLAELGGMPGIDGRSLAIARTDLQTGFMWAVRAIARPTTF